MVHVRCVLVTGIHPSGRWISGFFESVRWNTNVLRLDHCFITLTRQNFGGMELDPMLTPRENSPLPEGSEEDRIRDAASHKIASQTHYLLSYSGRNKQTASDSGNPSHFIPQQLIALSKSVTDDCSSRHSCGIMVHTYIVNCPRNTRRNTWRRRRKKKKKKRRR